MHQLKQLPARKLSKEGPRQDDWYDDNDYDGDDGDGGDDDNDNANGNFPLRFVCGDQPGLLCLWDIWSVFLLLSSFHRSLYFGWKVPFFW